MGRTSARLTRCALPACLLFFAVAAPAATSAPTLLDQAYGAFQAGQIDHALAYYQLARDAAADSAARTLALLGIQNCLVRDKRWREAVNVGDELLTDSPECVPGRFNRAYALFELAEYAAAVEEYAAIQAIAPGNLTAAEGEAWSLYRFGEFRAAVQVIDRVLARGDRSASMRQLYERILQERRVIGGGAWVTALDYHSALKDRGLAATTLLSLADQSRFSLDLALEKLSINMVSPLVPRHRELSWMVTMSRYGPTLWSISAKKIETNDPVFGEGYLACGRIERRGCIFQAAQLSLLSTHSTQGGVGYRWYRGTWAFSALLQAQRCAAMPGVPGGQSHVFFTQDVNWFPAPWLIRGRLMLGRNSLTVMDDGYVVANQPDEIRWRARLGFACVGDGWTASYDCGYLKGEHLLIRDRFDLWSHTLGLQLRW